MATIKQITVGGTTYNIALPGQLYCSCDTAAATAAKTVTTTLKYELVDGGIVTVKFANGNTANNPTLNINSKGAKNIFYQGAALADTNLIRGGDVVTLMYDGTQYHILSIDQTVTGIKVGESATYERGDVEITKADIGLGNVENTALSTWAGSTNITKLGTIATGTIPLNNISGADDLKKIEALTGATGLLKKTAANTWALDTTAYTTNQGTVTGVTLQTNSPLTGGSATAVTTSGGWTIDLADNYGDTKNPYADKTKNYVLAAPSASAGAPVFRALVAADIPNLDAGKITTGTLAVARGGTGRSALTGSNSLRNDLGFGTETGALTIAHGGTGATTAAAARTALETHRILYGTSTPAASLGEVGDIYVLYTA